MGIFKPEDFAKIQIPPEEELKMARKIICGLVRAQGGKVILKKADMEIKEPGVLLTSIDPMTQDIFLILEFDKREPDEDNTSSD